MSVDLRIGDCREILPTLDAESVHCCVTSPPYWGLRDYGHAAQIGLEPTFEEHLAELVAVFREVHRVLRKDGTLWLNVGDSYATSRGAGWQGNHGARANRTHTQRSLKNGSHLPASVKPKDLIGMPWRIAFALQSDGWWLRSDIIWAKPNPMPESVTDRPTKAHEYLFLLAKSERYYYDAKAIAEPSTGTHIGRVEHSRRDHSGNIERKPRPGPSGNGKNQAGGVPWEGDSRNRRSVWSIPTTPSPDAHFATFPRKLVEPCILAGCPPGGVVLDPFAGTGTVGRVAEDHGRNSLLIELREEYAAMAERKTAQMGLVP